MKVVVLQSSYLPWKGYFDLVNDADIFVFYDDVKYTKNDWRNRNKICSKNGVHWLTIPISKNAVRLKINEVTIENPKWQTQHYKSLYFDYKSAPYFSQLEELIEDLYKKHTWTHLVDINRYFVKKVSHMLGLKTEFVDSKDFSLEGDRVERLLSLLQKLNASAYISGPSAQTYLKDHYDLFEQKKIDLTFKDYSGYPEYLQLAKPFETGVSIVDMIANLPLEKIPEYIWGWRSNS